jgi:hypothetical protein
MTILPGSKHALRSDGVKAKPLGSSVFRAGWIGLIFLSWVLRLAPEDESGDAPP